MTRIDPRRRPRSGGWWTPFLTGAAAGLMTGLIVGARRALADDDASDVPADEVTPWSRLRHAWDDALEGASEGLAGARRMVAPDATLEPGALEDVLDGMESAAGCRLRVLSEGIVEVVGSCPSVDALAPVLAAVAAVPGVDVVVNRVWTPDSARPQASPRVSGAH